MIGKHKHSYLYIGEAAQKIYSWCKLCGVLAIKTRIHPASYHTKTELIEPKYKKEMEIR